MWRVDCAGGGDGGMWRLWMLLCLFKETVEVIELVSQAEVVHGVGGFAFVGWRSV